MTVTRNEALKIAKVLTEALPYIQSFKGKTIVVKYGGNAMTEETLKKSFAKDIVLMKLVGLNPIVVHGGGPQIGDLLEQLGIQSRFVDGMRVTDHATMNVVEMVLSGSVNKKIVQAINNQDGRAVGLSGKDAKLIICEQETPELGLVGSPTDVNPEVIFTLFENDMIPVIAPLGAGINGETLNINGDTVSGAIASALKADRLLLLTDVSGVQDKNGSIITELNSTQIKNWINEGIISGGMIPKTETALLALKGGVRGVVILDGRVPNACLLELFTEHGAGSLIRA